VGRQKPESLGDLLRKGGRVLKAGADALDGCDGASQRVRDTLTRKAKGDKPAIVEAAEVIEEAVFTFGDDTGGSLGRFVREVEDALGDDEG